MNERMKLQIFANLSLKNLSKLHERHKYKRKLLKNVQISNLVSGLSSSWKIMKILSLNFLKKKLTLYRCQAISFALVDQEQAKQLLQFFDFLLSKWFLKIRKSSNFKMLKKNRNLIFTQFLWQQVPISLCKSKSFIKIWSKEFDLNSYSMKKYSLILEHQIQQLWLKGLLFSHQRQRR